jgi:chitin disaccharide deacetylase
MRVIINADDLGLSREVNAAAFDLMSKRVVTSATILANGPFVLDALEGSKRFPACSFGVHLNLTEFRPMCQRAGLQDILGDNGEFTKVLDQTPQSARKTPRFLAAVAEEWCHQIEFLRKAGLQVSHLDSHQHVHTIPALFPVLKYVQARCGIRRVRTARNVYRAGLTVPRAKQLAKEAFRLSLKHLYLTRTTHAFMDFLTFHERAVVRRQNWPSVEVMVHPGSPADPEEDRLLRSDWPQRLRGAIQLISYTDL